MEKFRRSITKEIKNIKPKELELKCYFTIIHNEINPIKIFLDKSIDARFETNESLLFFYKDNFKKLHQDGLSVDYSKINFLEFNKKSPYSYLLFIAYMNDALKNKVYMCSHCIAIAETFNYL